MERSEILAAIDAEIERLRKAKALLEGIPEAKRAGKQRSVAETKLTHEPRTTGVSVVGRKQMAAAKKRPLPAAKKSAARRPARKAAKKNGGTEDGGFGFTQE